MQVWDEGVCELSVFVFLHLGYRLAFLAISLAGVTGLGLRVCMDR